MMDETLVFGRNDDESVRMLNDDWPRRIHIADSLLDFARQGKTNDGMRVDGDTVVFVVTNGSATYHLIGPAEREYPCPVSEYRLECCHLVLDT